MGGHAQAASDARRAEREKAAAFARQERKALRALGEACADQHAALVAERERAESGPAMNRFQYARLRYAVKVKQQAPAPRQQRAQQPPPRQLCAAPSAEAPAWLPRDECNGYDEEEEGDEYGDGYGGAARRAPRYGRRAATPPSTMPALRASAPPHHEYSAQDYTSHHSSPADDAPSRGGYARGRSYICMRVARASRARAAPHTAFQDRLSMHVLRPLSAIRIFCLPHMAAGAAR